MVIIMHCLCVTSGAESNEIELWIKLLTRDDSETRKAVRLKPPLGLCRTNELNHLTQRLNVPDFYWHVSKETKNKGIQCSWSISGANQADCFNSDKMVLLELFACHHAALVFFSSLFCFVIKSEVVMPLDTKIEFFVHFDCIYSNKKIILQFKKSPSGCF